MPLVKPDFDLFTDYQVKPLKDQVLNTQCCFQFPSEF